MERGTFFLFALTLKDYLSLQLDTFFFQFISNSSSIVFFFIFYLNQRSQDREVCISNRWSEKWIILNEVSRSFIAPITRVCFLKK